MVDPNALLAFCLTSIALIVIPGPSVLFVIGRSLAHGRRAGLLSVVGNELGALPLVAAVALGVGTIVADSIALFTIVKLVGAAYLAYLGVQAIRHRGVGLDELTATRSPVGPEGSDWVMLRQGFVVGVTNPKTIVFFIAVLPQFVDMHAGRVPLQMFVLGLIFVLLALVSDGLWAFAAGTARGWFASSPRRLSAVRATGGTMIVGLSGVLVLTGRKSL